MLKGKKTAGRGCGFFSRRAGRAGLAPGLALALCLVLGAGAQAAPTGGFSSSSARDGGNGLYFENHSFGTDGGAHKAFTSDPESGDRSFQTAPRKKAEEPPGIEIAPIRPEIYPTVPTPGQIIVIEPGNK